jgi:hypothetical protein
MEQPDMKFVQKKVGSYLHIVLQLGVAYIFRGVESPPITPFRLGSRGHEDIFIALLSRKYFIRFHPSLIVPYVMLPYAIGTTNIWKLGQHGFGCGDR